MTQETLKLALEALETELSIDWTNNDEFNASAKKMYEAIAAIKEALAQPEQKCPNLKNCNGACFQCEYFNAETGEMEYPVAPPEQEPVYGYCPECGAKGEMRERRPNGNDKCANGHTYPSSKSTPPQPEQEPVGDDWTDVLALARSFEAELKKKNT